MNAVVPAPPPASSAAAAAAPAHPRRGAVPLWLLVVGLALLALLLIDVDVPVDSALVPSWVWTVDDGPFGVTLASGPAPVTWLKIVAAAIAITIAALVGVSALLLALAVVLGAVLLSVGLPLLLALGLLLVLMSPLWLVGWLLWRAVRPRRSSTIAS